MAAPPPDTRPGSARTVVAALAVTIVRTGVLVLPFWWITGFVRVVNTGRAASRSEVVRVLGAVDAAARTLPFRIACLERSLAGLALLAARRRRVTWCLGVRRAPPIALHAWLADTTGTPVADSDTTSTYRPILTVPSDEEEPHHDRRG